MSKKMKITRQKASVADVVSMAFSDIQSLAEEVREVYDNAPESLQQGQRLTTLSESADTLEQNSEPDVPKELSDLMVDHGVWSARRMSRAMRRDAAVALLDDVISAVQSMIDDSEVALDSEVLDGGQQLIDELESAKSDWEGAEFPGMYG